MTTKEPEATISFRPIRPDDQEFLARLYTSTRWEELAPVPWSDEQKLGFLQEQFDAQHAYYQQQFPEARFDIVLMDGDEIGRLYTDRRKDEIRMIDIALLPATRGKGIGGQLVQDLLDEAAGGGLAVRIHVEKNNPAQRLYRRLGFVPVEDQGVYDLMEWRPESS